MNYFWTSLGVYFAGGTATLLTVRHMAVRVLTWGIDNPDSLQHAMVLCRLILSMGGGTNAPTAPAETRITLAGGGKPMSLGLYALPALNQLSAILPDGTLDPGAYDDCGETCVAAIVAAVHGTPISPASVRANLGGIRSSGLTTGDDLVTALAFYNVKAAVKTVSPAELQTALTEWNNLGFATIVLGEWPSPGNCLHWMLTTGVQGDWQFMNPWGGERQFLAWDAVPGLFRGQYVLVESGLHYNMRFMKQPF